MKKIIGILMLISFSIGLVIVTIVTYGVKDALKAWGIAVISSAFIVIAVHFISD